ETLAGQVGTGRHLQFGIDGDHLDAGFEGALDDLGAVVGVAAALHQQVAMIDEIRHRLGERLGQRIVGDRGDGPAGQDAGHGHVVIVTADEPSQAARDHAGTDDADTGDRGLGGHRIDSFQRECR
ncbi:piwi-like protein 3, partial [Corchorus olitorius]